MGSGEDGWVDRQADRQTDWRVAGLPSWEEGAWEDAEQTTGRTDRRGDTPGWGSGTDWGQVGFLDREGLPGGSVCARVPLGPHPWGSVRLPEDSGWGEGLCV